METFKFSFNILSVIGLWMQFNYLSSMEKKLYSSYRIFLIPMPFVLDCGVIAPLVLEEMDLVEFTETFFVALTLSNCCCKSITFPSHRKHVLKLSKMLTDDCALPHSSDEQIIHNYYNRNIRFLIYLF